MASDRLTREAVVGRALQLADAEGIEAVTIRRLAQELGVTPMALYWHFKNKELLLVGVFDVVFAEVAVEPAHGEHWADSLRAIVTALVKTLRRHPWVPSVTHSIAKVQSESFRRGTDSALGVLAEAGFSPERAFQIAAYLLHGSIALVAGDPLGPPGLSAQEAEQWRRTHRLELEALPPGRYPCLVEYARVLAGEPDVEGYYAFGIDLMMAGVQALAPAGGGPPAGAVHRP